MDVSLRLSVVSILALMLLSACAAPEWPLKTEIRVEVEGPRANKPKTTGPVFGQATTVVVGSKESVYVLSQRHGVSMRAIILANRLQPPFVLKVGQRVVIPREPTYRVKQGDTLSEIAETKGVGMYQLVRLNALKPPYTIFVGQNLRLPGQSKTQFVRKDTLPGSKSIKTISVNPKIRERNDKQVVSSPAANQKTPIWARSTEKSVAKMEIAPITQSSSVATTIIDPAPRAGKGFQWPVKGRVISTFGTKSKGLRNDGINIAAPRGTPVLATENGVVVYAGNELRGFGKLLLIKHAGGWVSAYAHNHSILVARGEKVKKGQQIARVGSTGGVVSPQLHFELRKGRHAKDPRKHLRRV